MRGTGHQYSARPALRHCLAQPASNHDGHGQLHLGGSYEAAGSTVAPATADECGQEIRRQPNRGSSSRQTEAQLFGFLSFAYTYHYSNWFLKAEVIRWNRISQERMFVIAAIYCLSIAIYATNYVLGFLVILLFGASPRFCWSSLLICAHSPQWCVVNRREPN
jgi:hypothetical protein